MNITRLLHAAPRLAGRITTLGVLLSAFSTIGYGQHTGGLTVAGHDPNCAGCQEFLTSFGGDNRQRTSGRGDAARQDGTDLGLGVEEFDQAPTIAPFPSELAATAGDYGAVPSMIGDFFGHGYQLGSAFGPAEGAYVARAGGDRTFKLAENNSPFPTNRVYFNYHHFSNALIDTSGRSQDVDRYTFGLEKTFLNENASIELRVPLVGGLDGAQVLGGTDTLGTELGNLALAVKALLLRGDNVSLAGGLAVVFPTGSDAQITDGSTMWMEFQNESLHLQPFLGAFWAPNERVFHQFLFQLDFDTTGSDAIVPLGSPLALYNATSDESSALYDQTLMYLDYQFGFWLHRRPNGVIRGIAPLVEFHYTTTLRDLDFESYEGRGVFLPDRRRDVLNLTGGVFFQLGAQTSVKIAGVAPLRDGSDKLFDSEFGLQLVRNY